MRRRRVGDEGGRSVHLIMVVEKGRRKKDKRKRKDKFREQPSRSKAEQHKRRK